MSEVAHQAGAYPGFCSMKRLRVFLLPPDGMLVHRRLIPPAFYSLVPIYTPGWSPRVQRNVPGQDLNPDHSIRSSHEATKPPTFLKGFILFVSRF